MADYSINLGVKLNIKDIDTQISSYNKSKNLIKVKADLDPSDITKTLNSYKAAPIRVDTMLNSDGITKAIRNYTPPKKIHLESELSVQGIDNKINGYTPKQPIKLNVELSKSSVNQQIKSANPSEQIKIKAKLDDDAITTAINSYKTSKPISIKINPDFSELNFNKVEELLKGYTARTPLKVNAQLNKTAINDVISKFNAELKGDRNRDVMLQVKITDAAISDALSKYNANQANKSKIPIDLTVKPNTEFDAQLKQRIAGYEKTPITIPAKLVPYGKGFASDIQKISVPIDVTLKNPKALNEAIKVHTGKDIPINATLVPAKNFDGAITKKPVKVHATLIPDEINKAIEYFTPKSKVKVGVELNKQDINKQVDSLPKPTQPLEVDVELTQSSINSAIVNAKSTSLLNVGVDLRTEDINAQIEAIHPTSKVKVYLDLDDNINADIKKQSGQTPINVNVKLDREDINKQIREFKTNTKIKVGVKLDFASHSGGQVGVPQQIKNYKTNTKVKVGVEIDRNSVNQALQGVSVTAPMPIGIELEPASVQRVQNQINNIRQQISALGNITINFGGNNRRNNIGNTTNAYQRASREVYNLYKQIESMELKLGNLDMSGINSGNIAQYRAQLDALRQTYGRLLATLHGQNGAIDLDLVFTDIDLAKTSMTELSSTVDNARTRLAKDIKINIGNNKLQSQVNAVEESFNNLGVANQQITDDIIRLRDLLNNIDASDDIESVTNDYREFLQLLKTVKNGVGDLQRQMNENNRPEILDAKKEAAMQRLNGLFEEGSQASKRFGKDAEKLANELNACGNIKGVDIVNQKIKNLGTEIKNSHLQTRTFGSRLKEQFSKYSSYFSIASVFMYGAQAARSMFEQVKLIDSAMTELKKVTNETDESYNKFLTNASSRAKEIGTTIDGLVSSTADFARLGYNFEDSQGLAEVANIYAVVGDEIEGVEDATESLISTMAAFKDEAQGVSNTDFATSIIDKFNEIGNNFAISSGGIGEAMKRSASSLDAANNTIDESIALITAANTVVQNPDKVGNAFKTISMRIRGAKTELEEAGESTEGMAESTASMRKEIMALSGVDIMASATEFKSTYQIMDELANKWEGLSDIAQASIIELMAGKHQGNVFASLMQNFDTAREALEVSANSAGSAMQEHAKWSESLEARLLKLKATWQSFSQSFMNSKFLKVGLNIITEFINFLDILIDKVGVIPTLLGGFAAFKFTKTLIDIGGIKSLADILPVLIEAFPRLSGGVSKLGGALKGAGGSASSLLGTLSGLISPTTLLVGGIAALAGVVIYERKKIEDLAESVEETTSKYREQHDALMKVKDDYDTSKEDSMINKYAELSKGIDEYGENISLTADEYAEYQGIVDNIANQFPDLITGYNSQGDAILSCAGNVGELTKAYKDLIKEQNNEVLKTGKDIFEDFNNDMDKAITDQGVRGLAKDSFTGTAVSHLEALEELFKSKNLEDAVNAMSSDEINRIVKLLEDSGIERDVLGSGKEGFENYKEFIIRAVKENKEEVKSALTEAFSDINAHVEDLNTYTESYFSTAFLGGDGIIGDYSHFGDKMQDIISKITSGFDASFYEQFDNIEELETYLNSMLTSFNSLDIGKQKELEAAFDLKTKFNGGEVSYGEYVTGLQEAGQLIDDLGLDKEIASDIKLSLGLNEKGLVEEYESLVNKLTSKEYGVNLDSENAKKFLNDLNYSEMSVVVDFVESGDVDFKDAIRNYQNVLDEAKEAGVDFSKTVYGNIDTNARQVLEWNGKNLKKFKDEIMSWEADDAKWSDVKKGYEDTISTVMGAWDTFKIDGKEVDIAFSPMLQTDGGAELLSSGTVSNYIEELIGKATEDGKWTNEELLKLDAEGIEIDGKKIQSILADIGDTAEATSMQMHFVGKDGALALEEDYIKSLVEKQAEINEALNFSINISAEKDGIEALNTALTESVSAMGLSSESLESLQSRFSELDSYDPSKLFEKTSRGIHLNREEFNKLEEELADSKLEEIDESLETVTGAYEDVTEKIRTCSDETERQKLLADQLSYANKIEELSEMQAQYEGLTSAYKKWIDAQEAGEEGDMYDSAMEGIESAKELYKKGLVGTNEFAAAVEFMSGKDTSSMSVEQIVSAYENAIPKMKRYFTESSKGAQNLLNDLNGINEKWAYINDSGEWQLDIPIEDAAKELGISVDALESILGKASDYGLEINYDSVYEASKSLETLYTEAETANEKLKELEKTDLTFSFESTDADDLTSQIEEATALLDEFKNEDGTVNLDIDGAEEAQTVLATLMRQKQEVTKPAFMEVSAVTVGDEDLANAIQLIQNLQSYKNTYDIQVAIDADTSETEAKIQGVIGEINTLKTENPQVFADLNLNTTEFNNALNTLGGNIEAGVTLDPNALATVQSSLNGVDAKVLADLEIVGYESLNNLSGNAQVTPTPTTTDLGDEFTGNATITPSPSTLDLGTKFTGEATINVSPNKTNLGSNFSGSGTINLTPNPTSLRVTVTGVSNVDGTANVNGTAFANGTVSGRAYKQGDWSIKDSGTALVGELGMETLVRNGRFYTIGDNGAEFIQYRKGDIIFNHKQTEELFKNGRVTSGGGRGMALADGTIHSPIGRAFSDTNTASGGGKLYGSNGNTVTVKADTVKVESKTSTTEAKKSSSSKSSSSKKSSSKKSSSSEDFEESIDWIEVAIDRIERAIDELDKKANSVYSTWSDRNIALSNQISEVGNEIDLQQKAYNRYIQEANSVGLSEAYAKKVRNGTIDIQTIKDEDTAEKIKNYQEWYNKALDCKDAIIELKETEAELYAQRFEHVQKQYDGILQGYEHTEAMLEEYISQAEEKGYIVSKKYYQALISNEKANISELKKEQSSLIAKRDEAVSSGAIKKGSEEWYNMCAEIDSVTQAIEERTTALLEYDNAIREIDWEVFDLIQERISAVSEEADFLIELMSNEKLFDDKGKLTGQGVATMGLHAQKYNDYMYQADDYGTEVSNLNAQIAKDPYDKELVERRDELLELQREMILAAEDEKNALRDLVEEGINLELDALQELIDKKNEELESEKDLYEYQKKVKEQTEEIASLEKQMSAYSGDDSEEAKAKIQELKVSLEDAKTELQETEWDKYINDTSALLDNLYLEYENILNQRLDNVDFLLQQVVDGINATMGVDGTIDTALSSEGAIAMAIANAVGENGSIKSILNGEVTTVGTTLSNAMSNIWSTGDGNIKSVLSTYGQGFQSNQTTTNAELSKIKADISAMVDDIDKDAKTKVEAPKTTTSAKKNPVKTTSTSTTTTKPTTTSTAKTTKTTSSGDGKAKVGDKVKFVSGKYYYDSYGKKPTGSKYQGKQVYITKINTKGSYPYHISTGKKLGSGDLGWLKLSQLSGYATGKKNFLSNEVAWTQENGKEFIVRPSDGAILTPIAKGDSVLNANASKNIWNMANSPTDFIKNNLGLDNANIPNGTNVNNNVTQNFESIVFSMPNVHSYNELLTQMQKDKNFEKLVLSMSVDRLAGKSSLAKNKSIR